MLVETHRLHLDAAVSPFLSHRPSNMACVLFAWKAKAFQAFFGGEKAFTAPAKQPAQGLLADSTEAIEMESGAQ